MARVKGGGIADEALLFQMVFVVGYQGAVYGADSDILSLKELLEAGQRSMIGF